MCEALAPYASEQALVAALVAGEGAAVEVLLRVYGPRIRNLAMHQFHCDEATARDLFQQVFLHLYEDDWRRLRLWTGQGSLWGYLRTIARRRMLEELRRQGREAPEDPDTMENEADSGYQVQEAARDRWSLMGCLRRALQRLPLRDRQLIHRRHAQGLSYREIAEAEGMTVNHVGVALLRAERRLAAWLERLCAELVARFLDRGGRA